MRSRDVAATAFYRRLIRAMGEFFGVAGGEEAVLEARTAAELVAALFADASIGGVVIDTGYPAPGMGPELACGRGTPRRHPRPGGARRGTGR
jgi:hypothetical protein